MSAPEDLASGKGPGDENFPVASVLLRPQHRAPILAFYRFARTADDVADHPTASADDKLARLEALRAGLEAGRPEGEGAVLAGVCRARGLTPAHGLELLRAFRQDVTQARYPDLAALLDYCRYSAMPVGRFVLDVHGESEALWAASDPLCAALQVINHLQDCAKDYRDLDRVYLPLDLLRAEGASPEDLGAPRASAGLRRVIAALAAEAQDLLARASGFSAAIRDRRLALEVAAIHRLAEDLAARLERRDPLCERVHHRPYEAAGLAAGAALARLLAPRRAA